MNSADVQDRLWNTAAGVLLWCFAFSMATLVLWFALLTLCGDWVYAWHSKFIHITRDQFNLVHYAGMALLKLASFTLLLFPFLGIRIVQRRRGN